jgi:hypothetical protein
VSEGSVPEEINVEMAHHLSGREGSPSNDRGDRAVEIVEVVVLAIVAIATAWSGYQAARWDGRQAHDYGDSSRLRFEAGEASTLGGQQRLMDVSTFNTWIQAYQEGNNDLAALYERRFSPEYEVAFDAWLKTDPFNDPNAPPGPAYMPEYHNALNDRATELNHEATTLFNEGTEARETADRYVRQTVLLATVLFLVAVEQRFRFRVVRGLATALAAVIMVVALVGVLTLPRL